MKSKLEGFLGAMAKLGSFDSNDSWARVRGVFDKLITHLFLIPKACDYYYYLMPTTDC